MIKPFAHVSQQDPLRRMVDIYVGHEFDDGSVDVLADGGRGLTVKSDPNAVTDPTARITDAQARALLEALVRHYQGAEDTRALRKDYDAERARVDRMIEMLGHPVVVAG